MKRWIAVAFSLLLIPLSASAQSGAMLPALPPSFLNASGVIASGAKLCTTATGTNNSLATYTDAALTTPLPNPITLNALGVPQTGGGTSSAIYLSAASYRITLYAAGTGNTCNGTAVGTQIWQRNGVYDLAQLFTLAFATKLDDKVCHASQYAGATADLKIAACIDALPSTGGTVDARGMEGVQSWAANPLSGMGTKPITLLLGASTISVAATVTISNGNGFIMEGIDGTVLKWTGSSGTAPIVQFSNCERCSIRHIDITMNGGSTAEEAIRLWRVSPVTTVSISQDHFEDIDINGTGGTLTYGVRIMVGSGGDTNNDFHTFRAVRVQGYVTAAWSLEGGNVHGIHFYDCLFYGGSYGVTSRTNSPTAANFIWEGGYGTATAAAFYLGDAAAMGPIVIDGFQSETTPRLLDLNYTNEGNGVNNYENPVHIRNVRYMTDNLHADGYAIKYINPAPLIVEETTIGFNNTAQRAKSPTFYIEYSVETYVKRAATFRNVIVIGTLSTFNTLFPNDKPTVCQNVIYRTADNNASGNACAAASLLSVNGTGTPPFLTVDGKSTATNQRAGFGYAIDGAELWRTEVTNDVSNGWRLRYNNTTDAISWTTGVVATFGGSTSCGIILNTAVKICSGAGTPEAAITAPIGSTYSRTDGGAGTSFYVKESGTGNTGWVGK